MILTSSSLTVLQESNGLALDVQGRGIFNLDACDRVSGMCPAKGKRQDFGEPEAFDLPSSRENENPDL
jgi:hypothetical protein